MLSILERLAQAPRSRALGEAYDRRQPSRENSAASGRLPSPPGACLGLSLGGSYEVDFMGVRRE